MRVLFISTSDYKYGAAKTLIDMMLELKKSYGVEPVVLTKKRNPLNELCDKNCIENDSFWYRDIMAGSAYSIPILNWLKHCVKYAQYVYGAITQRKVIDSKIDFESIDIVHSNHIRVDIGVLLSKLYGKPHVWHIKELNKGHCKIVHYKSNCYSYINRNADAFIAVTNQVKEYWTLAGLDADRIRVIYEGIDTNKFVDRIERDDDLLRMVVVGRIEEAKGQLQVVEAVSMLPEEIRRNIHIDLWGDAYFDYRRKINRFVERNNMASIVDFRGYCTDIPSALRQYDVGILSSKGDAFGTVTAEYMAAGLITIATYSELVEDRISGYRYEFGDIKSLKEIIEWVYYNRSVAEETAKQGKRVISRDFTIQSNARSIYKLYTDVLNGKFINKGDLCGRTD